MKRKTVVCLLICLLTITVLALADSPPANSIPIIGLKANYEDIDTEFFCLLSWNNFDGLSRQFYDADSILKNVVLPGDTTGMLTLVNPWNVTCVTNWYSRMFEMSIDKPYAWPVWAGYTIGDTTYTQDALRDTMTASQMQSDMINVSLDLETLFNDSSHSVWFYYGYDEAPAHQWMHMMDDSSAYDDYMPSFFTQDFDSVMRPDLDSITIWQPTLEEVDPNGVISWMKWHIEQADATREQSFIISTMHSIEDWAGYTNWPRTPGDPYPATFTDQAEAIRSIFNMRYQNYPPPEPPLPPTFEDNSPTFIAYDAYPFRLVGTVQRTQIL